MKFRTLEAAEIDARIGTINANGLSLLLYKDARADMIILDEEVGCLNWKREHSRENANCIVSIWDEEKKQWISKEDTGAESFTEKEKGLASDSFKRACVNWGIGRELYTSPFIWIKATEYEVKEKNGKFMTYDKFVVTQISYDDKRNITFLEIKNDRTNKVIFRYGTASPQKPPQKPPQNENTPSQANVPPTDKTSPQPQQEAADKKAAKVSITKMLAIANGKGFGVDTVKKMALKKFNKEDLYSLTVSECSELSKGFEGLKPKEEK